jgi:dolichyl-phosphate beta-glucosyltransferase
MTQSHRGEVSIVIPAFREERRIGAAVRGVCDLAKKFPRLVDVIVVVEPSGDRTAEVARSAAAGDQVVRVVECAVHRGKGYAVRAGMLEARGDIVFFMDADLSVPLSYVSPFVDHLDGNPQTDAVIGDRRHAGSRITRRQHPLREMAGRGFNLVVRALGLSPSKDTQCGFKAFRRKAARDIFARTRIDGFAFDAEALLMARRLGLRVDDLPVEWINDEETKFRFWADGWRSLADLMRLRIGRE